MSVTKVLPAALGLLLLGCGSLDKEAETNALPPPDATRASSALSATSTPPEYGDRIDIEITGILGGGLIGVGGEGAEAWVATSRALSRLDLSDPRQSLRLREHERFPVAFTRIVDGSDALWATDGKNGVWRRARSCQRNCWKRVWQTGWTEVPAPEDAGRLESRYQLPRGPLTGDAHAGRIDDIVLADDVPDTIAVLTNRGLWILKAESDGTLREVASFPESEDAFWTTGLETAGRELVFGEHVYHRRPDAVWRARRISLADPEHPKELEALELPSPGQQPMWSALLGDGRVAVYVGPYEWGLTPDDRAVDSTYEMPPEWSNLLDESTTVLITRPVESALVQGSKLVYVAPEDAAVRVLDGSKDYEQRESTLGRFDPHDLAREGVPRSLHGPVGDLALIARPGLGGLAAFDLSPAARGVLGSLEWPDGCDNIELREGRLWCRSDYGTGANIDVMSAEQMLSALGLPSLDEIGGAELAALGPRSEDEKGDPAEPEDSVPRNAIHAGERAFYLLEEDLNEGFIIERVDSSLSGDRRVSRLGPYHGYGRYLWLRGDTLLVGPGEGPNGTELLVIDVSNPDDLQEIARVAVGGLILSGSGSPALQFDELPGLVFFDDQVYDPITQTRSHGFTILDLSDPMKPHIAGEISGLGYLRDLEYLGDGHLIASAGDKLFGLRLVFDADP